MDKDSLHKEIDLIQSIITRMANNSFLIKGWYITILSAIVLITRKEFAERYQITHYIIFLVPLLFWYIDAFYLKQEILYRKLYNWVIQERIKGNQSYLYDLNPGNRLGKQSNNLLKIAISPTLLIFYGIPIILYLLITCFAK